MSFFTSLRLKIEKDLLLKQKFDGFATHSVTIHIAVMSTLYGNRGNRYGDKGRIERRIGKFH